MESILIKEDYNFKLLKYVLFNSSIGYIKLHRIGLIYGLIDCMANCLKDFKMDWQCYNTTAKALLDVLTSKYLI